MRTPLNRKRGRSHHVSATHRMSTKACAWQRYTILNTELKKVRTLNTSMVRQGEVVPVEQIQREMELERHTDFALKYYLSVRYSRVS